MSILHKKIGSGTLLDLSPPPFGQENWTWLSTCSDWMDVDSSATVVTVSLAVDSINITLAEGSPFMDVYFEFSADKLSWTTVTGSPIIARITVPGLYEGKHEFTAGALFSYVRCVFYADEEEQPSEVAFPLIFAGKVTGACWLASTES